MKQRPILALAIFLLFPNCTRSPSLETSTRAAAPGESVRLHLSFYRGDVQRLRVTVADRPAHIVLAADSDIDILVPPLDVDSTTIAVRDGDRTIVSTGLRVLPARSWRLLITVDAAGVRIVNALPSSHAPTGVARTRRTRLSFDVINRNNVVVYSGSIPHPAHQPAERFVAYDSSGAGAMAVEPPAQSVVPVYIPTPDDSVRVIFYTAGPGLDLMSTDGRAKRQRLAQIEVSR
jgi:hypothetical protein